MTKDRLDGLPIKVLMELAKKENLDFEPDVTQKELVENLLEAYEEDLRERETLHKLIIEIEQSKFFYLSKDFFVEEWQSVDVPDSYDENAILFVLRDPVWALVFWEIRRSEEEALRKEIGFRQLGLKVFKHVYSDKKERSYFFIPLEQPQGARYIHLPAQHCWYHVELYALFDKESRLLAASPRLFSPLEKPSFLKNKTLLNQRHNKLLELSGIQLCEPVRKERFHEILGPMHNQIPQRINDEDEPSFKDPKV